MNEEETKVNIEWNFKKSIQKNLKDNKFQLVHYHCNNVLEPWKDKLLEKYIKEDFIQYKKCLVMRIYEEDKCALYTPHDPRTILRTPIFYNENMTIKFTISFNDEINSTFFWFRDVADICLTKLNIFELRVQNGYIYLLNKHDDYEKISDLLQVDELVKVEIVKRGGKLYIKLNEDEFVNDVEFGDCYWMNFGLMNEKSIENSINIYELVVKSD